jgi:tRNA pseudouridine55 synthase
VDGVLILDKAQGPTSHDLVQRLRRVLGVKRIGHGGTLDPMATGVMVLLIGRATKLQQLVQQQRKEYEATIQLGVQTDTADAWGRPVREAPVPELSAQTVRDALGALMGPVAQTPPAYSAVRVQGRRSYEWARRGTPMAAAPRTIQIYDFELLEQQPARLRCRIACSSGTYVRTLAEQLAERLGTVGHVQRLVRTAVGPWTVEQAHPEGWLQSATSEDVVRALMPWARAASLLASSAADRPACASALACRP